jgi:hypothetical protein
MSDTSAAATPTYERAADPDRSYADYYPPWLEKLADDVTIEGSLLDGAAQGPDAVRAIVGTLRTLYEGQEFNHAGPYRETGWIEDYNARVGGQPIAGVILIARDAEGNTRHVAANYRPRSSLLLLSKLVGEKLAGTPHARFFLNPDA